MFQRDKALIGAILKAERIRQQRSQIEVCNKICVPSYLSKIENGQVAADAEILEKLYEKLGMKFVSDEGLWESLKAKLDDLYERIEYNLDWKAGLNSLKADEEILRHSTLVIDWLIAKKLLGACDELRDSEALEGLRANMSDRQRAYYVLASFDDYTDEARRISDFEEAAGTLGSSYAMDMLCHGYYKGSEYGKIHQLENKMVAAAISEGNLYRLADFYMLNGSAYASLNAESMMMTNYQKAIRLLQNTGWKGFLCDVYYNMGATYISLKKFDLAVENLLQSLSMVQTDDAEGEANKMTFGIYHKLALACIRKGEVSKGRVFLRVMDFLVRKHFGEDSLQKLIFDEAEQECSEGFTSSPEYLQLLEKLIKRLRKERHFGYVYFYSDVLLKAYTSQRMYKKALDFQSEVSRIIIFNKDEGQ